MIPVWAQVLSMGSLMAAMMVACALGSRPGARPKSGGISADFPFASRYVDVLGSRMHYIDEGRRDGDPILFVHGNPTSVYLWRNIVPHLTADARVLAVDLIGMGKSDKPPLAYAYADHIRYFEGFVAALGLTKLTLVGHDWGSALVFDYASRHADDVKAIAFMEAMFRPVLPTTWETLREQDPDLVAFFELLRGAESGPRFVIDENGFVEKILPENVLRTLSAQEMDAYRAPYVEPASRKPILVWPNQIPISGEPGDVVAVMDAYSDWLYQSSVPKLHLVASPGVINPPELAAMLQSTLPSYRAVEVGEGLHYIQEDHPHEIGQAIAEWYRQLE